MNELNSNLIELYFKINNKKGELSGQEIRDKLSNALNIEFTKQFINVNKELVEEDNNKEDEVLQEEELIENTENTKPLTKLNNIKPNLSFYYLHNKFQIVKVIIRPYEKELII